MKFLFPLLLVGCSTYPYHELSYDELYQQASDCKSAKAIGCDPLWEEVNRRDAVKEKRDKKNKSMECPNGEVVLKKGHSTSCISQADLRWVLRGMRY